MMQSSYQECVQRQRKYFNSHQTLSSTFRITQLKKLRALLVKHEAEIALALKQDLNKSMMESIVAENMLLLKEIDYAVNNLRKWDRPKRVNNLFPMLWPGRSEILSEPYGTVLIIGPWNYPFLLMMLPLIGAISAGNCVILKPSEVSSYTETMLSSLINDNFPSEYLCAVSAGPQKMPQLLQEKFDYIFYTGNFQIAKVIMQAAAAHLTPVTLELGGKSPVIVDETADLRYAAHRIAWAKVVNAGQTCIAPDYLYVHRSCKDKLITLIKQSISEFLGEDPEKSLSYTRIINQKHFDRIANLIDSQKIIFGGKTNSETRYIEPTLLHEVSWEDKSMQEEIFGPVLPILVFDDLTEVIQNISNHPKPLSLYYFTTNKDNENRVMREVSFGNGCINDCLTQFFSYYLPFGGVGQSGMGAYRGKYSFETFSHQKAIYKKTWTFENKLLYPPYSAFKLWCLRWLSKL